jgi:serine/threonine protein kinase
MAPTRQQVIESICNLALDVPPAKREAFVARLCGGDDGLKDEVARRLGKQQEAPDPLPVPDAETAIEKCASAARASVSAAGGALVGKRVGRYLIFEFIGAGGMGAVYKASDTRLDRVAALKILPVDMAGDEDRVRRFSREARASANPSHPNIATVYDVGQYGDIHYIAMEYVEGQTLAARISGRQIETDKILDIALHVCDALDVAHAKGVVHRDIKPANIMITTRGQVKVLDFGLAKITGRVATTGSEEDISAQSSSTPGAVRGTIQYISPEQALGHDIDCRSDIFSFGVTMYETATGRRPFSGSSANEIIDRIIHTRPDAVARFNYNTPPHLEYVIRKCMEKDPGRRYQSSHEVVVDPKHLKRDVDSGTIAADLPKPQPRHRLRRSRCP